MATNQGHKGAWQPGHKGAWQGQPDPTFLSIFKYDGVSAGESIQAAESAIAINVNDGVTLGENTNAAHSGLSYTVTNDGVTVGDTVTALLNNLSTSVVDGITAGEDVSGKESLEVMVYDSAVLGENINVKFDIVVNVNDNISVLDYPTIFFENISLSVYDGVLITENVNNSVANLVITSTIDELTSAIVAAMQPVLGLDSNSEVDGVPLSTLWKLLLSMVQGKFTINGETITFYLQDNITEAFKVTSNVDGRTRISSI
jgi:hypothetical protein